MPKLSLGIQRVLAWGLTRGIFQAESRKRKNLRRRNECQVAIANLYYIFIDIFIDFFKMQVHLDTVAWQG
ncbi:hypothetical protein [Coleofasciculus sp. H7-2]|uniref:hypothetical protein n=1 Tax=Coleofasciculus sp. H7-2 TaxID=3351545 RepID=UPI0036705F7D